MIDINFQAIREAIIAGNQDAVNNLLAQLKSAQVREELDKKIDGKNHIEFVRII
jgi:predicted sulfurtransferase